MIRILPIIAFLSFLSGSQAQFVHFPVTLSLPYDTDTIQTTDPTLVWQCNISAIQSDPRLSQQLVLVELLNDQTNADAILLNQPLCVVQGLLSTSYSYPSTQPALEKGKTYVWQVQLLYNDQPVQQSEPWRFTIDDPRPPKEQFILLRRQPDGSRYVLEKPALYVMIPNDRHRPSASATIRDAANVSTRIELKQLTEEDAEGKKTTSASNLYFMADLKDAGLKKGNYTLEWRSGKGQVYYLPFQLK